MTETYTKEEFEDCPRFMPMQYNDSITWYIFDTEKLKFLDDIVPYYDIKDCENACNILNGLEYMLNDGDV